MPYLYEENAWSCEDVDEEGEEKNLENPISLLYQKTTLPTANPELPEPDDGFGL